SAESSAFARLLPGGFGRLRRATLSALLPLLRLELGHVSGGKVDRVEEERREAGARHGFGNDLPGKGKDGPRCLDEEERLKRFLRNVAKAEQPGVAQVDDEMD